MFENLEEYFSTKRTNILIEVSYNKSTDEMYAPHIHNWYEMYYLINGNSNYTIGDAIYHLEPRDVILIPPGIPHKSNTLVDLKRINIYFKKDYFTEERLSELTKCFDKNYYKIPSDISTQVDIIFKTLLKEQNRALPDSNLIIRNYTEILLILLNRLRDYTNEQDNSVDQDIQKALSFINTHLNENLTLQYVANEIGLNPNYFSRKFKKIIGSGFNDYITYARIGRAQQMLINTELSLLEISEKCGFQDGNYFSTVFKRVIGISPVKFRKQNKLK